MIIVAPIWILIEAVEKWLQEVPLEHLGSGAILLLGAGWRKAWLELVPAARG